MTTDAVGGVWNYSLALAGELAQRGAAVCLGVIGPLPSPDRVAAAQAAGIDWISIDAELDWLAGSEGALAHGRAAIARAAKDWGADILQVNQPAYAGDEYHGAVVTVAHSCVLTWWLGTHRRPAPPEWNWHISAVRQGLKKAAIAIAPSRSFAAMLQRAYRLESAPSAILNGMASRPIAGTACKQQFVLASGRIWDESKNFGVLDMAAPLIDWRVEIAGDYVAPGTDEALKSKSASYLGRLSAMEMAEHYGRAAIYVSPSLHEPFGLGVLGAAQRGAALVLSDIDSFRELWGGAALFFNPRDPISLAASVNQLIHDPARRRKLSEAAIRRAARYNIQATAREMCVIYARAAKRAAKVPA